MSVDAGRRPWRISATCPEHDQRHEARMSSTRGKVRPPALDDVKRDRLLRVFLSGISSGVSSYLLQLGTSPQHATRTGLTFAQRLATDPAFRHDVSEDLGILWTTGRSVGLKLRTAYIDQEETS